MPACSSESAPRGQRALPRRTQNEPPTHPLIGKEGPLLGLSRRRSPPRASHPSDYHGFVVCIPHPITGDRQTDAGCRKPPSGSGSPQPQAAAAALLPGDRMNVQDQTSPFQTCQSHSDERPVQGFLFVPFRRRNSKQTQRRKDWRDNQNAGGVWWWGRCSRRLCPSRRVPWFPPRDASESQKQQQPQQLPAGKEVAARPWPLPEPCAGWAGIYGLDRIARLVLALGADKKMITGGGARG